MFKHIKPNATDQQQVRMGQLITVVLMVAACGLALLMRDALSNFEVLLQIGAGPGLIFLLRWFWWRINAVAEMTAMVVSFACALYFGLANPPLADWQRMLCGIGLTTVAWLVVAWVSPPTEDRALREFYRRIQPAGPGWDPVIASAAKEGINLRKAGAGSDLPAALLGASAATASVWALIFAGGFAVYGKVGPAVGASVVALAAGWVVTRVWPKLKWG